MTRTVLSSLAIAAMLSVAVQGSATAESSSIGYTLFRAGGAPLSAGAGKPAGKKQLKSGSKSSANKGGKLQPMEFQATTGPDLSGEVGIETLKLQNEAIELNDVRSGAAAKRAPRNVKGASGGTGKTTLPSPQFDGKYVLPSVRHTFGGQGRSKPGNRSSDGGKGRPAAGRQVDGLKQAPSPQEDKYGQVKVQFHWDREGKK